MFASLIKVHVILLRQCKTLTCQIATMLLSSEGVFMRLRQPSQFPSCAQQTVGITDVSFCPVVDFFRDPCTRQFLILWATPLCQVALVVALSAHCSCSLTQAPAGHLRDSGQVSNLSRTRASPSNFILLVVSLPYIGLFLAAPLGHCTISISSSTCSCGRVLPVQVSQILAAKTS